MPRNCLCSTPRKFLYLSSPPIFLTMQLHGTCLGFETLAVIASKNHSILSEFDAENLPSPLFPTDKAEKRWA